jgi:RNA polymerase sigma-70 factor (ECF subfamily)
MNALPRPRAEPPAPATDEAAEVRAAQAGDRAAFDALVARAFPRLLGTAQRLLGDAYAAEEAVADALFRAWTHLRRFRGGSAFSTWTHRILCRVAADRYRARARETRHRGACAPRGAAGRRAPAAGDRAEARDEATRLRAAAAALPEMQRLVLLLHAWEGLSLRELAEVLRLRYATAKSHLHHARVALRRALGGEA